MISLCLTMPLDNSSPYIAWFSASFFFAPFARHAGGAELADGGIQFTYALYYFFASREYVFHCWTGTFNFHTCTIQHRAGLKGIRLPCLRLRCMFWEIDTPWYDGQVLSCFCLNIKDCFTHFNPLIKSRTWPFWWFSCTIASSSSFCFAFFTASWRLILASHEMP